MNGTQKTKTITHKSAMPYYAAGAIFLLWALITPIYKLAFLLIGAALAVAAWLLAGKFFPGRVETYTVQEFTGDEELDKQIKFARELNERISAIAKETPDEAIRTSLTSISASTDRIIEDVVRDSTGTPTPSSATICRRSISCFPSTPPTLAQAKMPPKAKDAS